MMVENHNAHKSGLRKFSAPGLFCLLAILFFPAVFHAQENDDRGDGVSHFPKHEFGINLFSATDFTHYFNIETRKREPDVVLHPGAGVFYKRHTGKWLTLRAALDYRQQVIFIDYDWGLFGQKTDGVVRNSSLQIGAEHAWGHRKLSLFASSDVLLSLPIIAALNRIGAVSAAATIAPSMKILQMPGCRADWA